MKDIEFPKELGKKCTKEEFDELMKFKDTEIPIEEVDFSRAVQSVIPDIDRLFS